MAAALDAFFDVLSATLGAASGAIVTALANRQKNTSLKNQIVVGQRELEKIRLENNRLLQLIEERENQILANEQEIAKLRTVKSEKSRKQKSG